MWFFKRKKMRQYHQQKEDELRRIKADTKRRTMKATRPIEKLTERFESNGLTLEIKRGLGNRHA